MKVLLTLEDHLNRCEDGHFYVHGPGDYSAWCELLEVFDEVLVVARATAKILESAKGSTRVDGPSISVHGLSDYTGPWQYLIRLPSLQAEVRAAVAGCDAFILRVPGLVSRLVWHETKRLTRARGVEVVGDPWDAMGRGTMTGLLRPMYRRIATHSMRRMCESATSALYWSECLQRRYPVAPAAATFVSPRILLPKGFANPEVMKERWQRISVRGWFEKETAKALAIGYVGSFAQLYKGPDTLLHALSLCSRGGLNFKAFFAGEGRYRKEMEGLAQDLGIGDKTVFMGQLGAGGHIADFLDGIDLFVMPSRAEGLGRALIEAMARGCPSIGSMAGAIPELLYEDDLVPAGSPEALARKIFEVAESSERMQAMSKRNLEKAREFQPDLLREVRRSFYGSLRRPSHEGICKRINQLIPTE